MRILVSGSKGFVGHKVMEMIPAALATPSLRGASEEKLRQIVDESEAEVIINTAAISDIPTCEAKPDASYEANVLLPLRLAKAAGGRKLIFFSSDQVYSGSGEEGPYTEDMVKPANLYAKHKWEMEQRVLDVDPEAVMLRAEWMYDVYPFRENYFMQILHAQSGLAFSSGQFRGIAYLREVVENLERAAALPGGAYNFGSETQKSMYEITTEFLEALGKQISVSDIPARHNLWMNCSKAEGHGIRFSTVEAGLLRCAEDYGLLRKPM
ncbi:MAG: sugar nucleotide-binding protein [Oscillospiraceae bacterium]|nr:sugar nucleotide-binding protein [Oscillospiraceae bacterium]